MLQTRYYFLLCAGFVGYMFISGGSFVYGQKTSSDSTVQFFWVNGGFGGSLVNGGIGSHPGALSFGGSLCYQSGKNLLSFRYLRNVEFQIFWPDLPIEKVWDVGVLCGRIGRIAKASYGFASISSGMSIVGGVRRGRYLGGTGEWVGTSYYFGTSYYEENDFITVGIPVEGQLFWTPLAFFGIGFYGFANLNPEKSFVGALLCVQIGKLK